MASALQIERVAAAMPLIKGGMPVWRAAHTIGSDMIYLCAAFRAVHGVTPGQWARSLPPTERGKVYRRTIEGSQIQDLLKGRRVQESARSLMCGVCGADMPSPAPGRCAKCGASRGCFVLMAAPPMLIAG